MIGRLKSKKQLRRSPDLTFLNRLYFRVFPRRSDTDAVATIRNIIDTSKCHTDAIDKIDDVLIEVGFFPEEKRYN